MVFGRIGPTPFISIDGYAPVGEAVASTTDMPRYLITQLQRGVTPEGTRVASAANVDRTHQPGIEVPPDALNALPGFLLPDTAGMNYCLGWFDQRFTDGRHLLWHAGGIDGFGQKGRAGHVHLRKSRHNARRLRAGPLAHGPLGRKRGLAVGAGLLDVPAVMRRAPAEGLPPPRS